MKTSKWEEFKKELTEMANNMEVTNDFELGSKDMLHTILNEMNKIENEGISDEIDEEDEMKTHPYRTGIGPYPGRKKDEDIQS